MQNPMVVFTFSVLDRKHPIWANLAQQIEIVSLSWNSVLNLIEAEIKSNMQNTMVVFTFLFYTINIFFSVSETRRE